MADGSHSAEDSCFPTPSFSSFGGEVFPQDNVNPRREEHQEWEPLQGHEQSGASSPPAGPPLQFGTLMATIQSYTGPFVSVPGL